MTARLARDLAGFFADCVYPAEPEFAAEGGTECADSLVLAKVRAEAQRRGWWNLLSSLHPAASELDTTTIAELAEIVGRSPIIGQVALNSFNPDAAVIELIAALGSAGQRERWLPGLAEGTITSALCMSEPGVASSDPRSLTTRGDRGSDGSFVLSGAKAWCTGAEAPACRLLVVFALTEPDARPADRYSIVLVPRNEPGVSLAAGHRILGHANTFRGGHPDIVFNAARGDVLGEPGQGLAGAQRVLGPARMIHCMRLVGTAERALELMAARLRSREIAGRSLAENDLWIDRIGAARISIESMRALVRSMATQGGSKIAESIVKAEVPARVTEIIDLAIQAHGADGLSGPGILADLYAHARGLRIGDGPDEVHRRVVGRHELARHELVRHG